jgi:hypothetical protein
MLEPERLGQHRNDLAEVLTSPKLGFWTGKPSSVQVRESVKSISYVSLW